MENHIVSKFCVSQEKVKKISHYFFILHLRDLYLSSEKVSKNLFLNIRIKNMSIEYAVGTQQVQFYLFQGLV